MLKTQIVAQMPPLTLFPGPLSMTDDEFFAFCQANRALRIERSVEGDIIIMTPAGGETGSRNATLAATLWIWARKDGRGVAFDSSTGFVLPNGAMRAPNAAWALKSRLAALSPEQKQKFLPLCPDFIVELRSPTDLLADLQAKLEEYRANGAALGWLIDPDTRTVHDYRQDEGIEVLEDAAAVSAEPVLPGFELDLAEIWDPGF